MTAATLALTDFLLARIAEDEERAKRAAAVEGADFMLAALPLDVFDGLRVAFPARVLAECAAKRAIVEQHPWGEDDICTSNEAMGNLSPIDSCPVLRNLAAVYADHPDHRDEWRP